MTNDRYDVTDLDRLQNAEVVDSSGDRIGGVGQIYVDDQTSQPTFATVRTGLFGSKESFVPLHEAQIGNGTITVPYTKDIIKGAPNVDADGHLSEAEQDDIYRYYQQGGAGYREGFAGDPTLVERDTARQNGTYVADPNWDRDRTVDTTRTANVGDNTMVRREEELHVGTERVETGRVRLRKHVVTEQKTVTVPVQREEFEVVREPIADGQRSNGTLGDDEQVVTLSEERPVVEKVVVDKERVGLQTNVVTDQQQVQAQVGREEIEVDNSGVTGNRVTDGTYTDANYTDTNRGESLIDKAKDHLQGDHDHDGVKDKNEL